VDYIYAYISKKIGKKQILCRSGFKFIRFTSKILINDNNEIIYLKKKLLFPPNGKLKIQIRKLDIIKETLTDILIKDFNTSEDSILLKEEPKRRNFNKFLEDYNENSKKTANIDFSCFTNLDIIDLSKISEIKLYPSTSNIMNECIILEITKKKNIYKRLNSGLTKLTAESELLLESKFYYAFLATDTHYIMRQDNEMRLIIDNEKIVGLTPKTNIILLIKFNKKVLNSYLKKVIINQLAN
tara:strand:- start:620 stop:1342 length:723 start_codon:yes stop_codon:yes gene_type:complete